MRNHEWLADWGAARLETTYPGRGTRDPYSPLFVWFW